MGILNMQKIKTQYKNQSKTLTALSLFANIGISEVYLREKCGIHTIVANELEKKRAEIYSKIYPDTKMIVGDITLEKTKQEIYTHAKSVDLIIATAPCQSFSPLNANKDVDDPRNFLICHALEVFNKIKPKYMLIENVSQIFTHYINIDGKNIKVVDYIKSQIPANYRFQADNLNAKDYGTAQSRKRAIIRISRDDQPVWIEPIKQTEITVKQAIGHLPSLEHGEDSGILYHKAKKHNAHHVECLQHTPTGCSAMANDLHYPRINNGTGRRAKGFKSLYKRINADAPAPTITMNNSSPGGQSNIHYGRFIPEKNIWSDARVLTLLEILILTGLPTNWRGAELISEGAVTENNFRRYIGEGVPPKFMMNLLLPIVNAQFKSGAVDSEIIEQNSANQNFIADVEVA